MKTPAPQKTFEQFPVKIAGLKQILSPNKAQTSFVSGKYIPIFVQP
jgi:hypothetical protein